MKPLRCDIHASPESASDLERIAHACAVDVGQKLAVLHRVSTAQPVITLRMSVEEASSQHPAWCLACRLACFCPTARVSIFVDANSVFRPAAHCDTTEPIRL